MCIHYINYTLYLYCILKIEHIYRYVYMCVYIFLYKSCHFFTNYVILRSMN